MDTTKAVLAVLTGKLTLILPRVCRRRMMIRIASLLIKEHRATVKASIVLKQLSLVILGPECILQYDHSDALAARRFSCQCWIALQAASQPLSGVYSATGPAVVAHGGELHNCRYTCAMCGLDERMTLRDACEHVLTEQHRQTARVRFLFRVALALDDSGKYLQTHC